MVKTAGTSSLPKQSKKSLNVKTSVTPASGHNKKNESKVCASPANLSCAESWKCELCQKQSRDESACMLECEVCDLHYCQVCLKLSDDDYDMLCRRPDIHWFCAKCEPTALLSIKNDKEIAQRCADYFHVIESKISLLQSKVDHKADTSRVDLLERNIEVLQGKLEKELVPRLSKIEENIDLHLSDDAPLIQACRDNDPATVHKSISEAVNSQMAEEKDIAQRKSNLIIYRVPESDDSDNSKRIDHDKKFFLSLVNEALDLDINDSDIDKLYRLGSAAKRDLPRPLLVKLREEKMKWEVMKNLKKLRVADDKYRIVSVANDLTPKQRQLIREMVQDAKEQHDAVNTEERDSSENFRFLVVGLQSKPRVIKTRRTN